MQNCTHNVLIMSPGPIKDIKMEVFLNMASNSLHSNQTAITAEILIEGIYLGFSHNLHLEILEPRQKTYYLDECITGLDDILEKMKTYKMAVSKLRHYKDCYLTTIFLSLLNVHLYAVLLINLN